MKKAMKFLWVFVAIIIIVTSFFLLRNYRIEKAYHQMENIAKNEMLLLKETPTSIEDAKKDVMTEFFYVYWKSGVYFCEYKHLLYYGLGVEGTYGLLYTEAPSRIPHWIEARKIGDSNWYSYRYLL